WSGMGVSFHRQLRGSYAAARARKSGRGRILIREKAASTLGSREKLIAPTERGSSLPGRGLPPPMVVASFVEAQADGDLLGSLGRFHGKDMESPLGRGTGDRPDRHQDEAACQPTL